ncbi:MAG: hypothetical protein COA47_17585 [Robiginitomaculum sp.]|nr:MAG: hypothetical protein COA47_17585 [Robiginitomaculum sp.]
MPAKKWVKFFFIVFLTCVNSVAIFNWRIDSLGLFKTNAYIGKIVNEVTNNKIVNLFEKNFNYGILRKEIIQNTLHKVDWIVLGSSRSMALRKRFFLKEADTFQNYSIPAASLKNYMAIVSIFKDYQKTLPENVIIEIDPTLFNTLNREDKNRFLNDDYIRLLNEITGQVINKSPFNIDFIKKLYTTDYLFTNIEFLRKRYISGFEINTVTDTSDYLGYLIEPDGSRHYSLAQKKASSEIVERQAVAIGKFSPLMGGFNELANVSMFELFIQYLTSHDVNVIFYLPPYHPITYDLFLKHDTYKIIAEVEKYILTYASRNDIVVLGSYDPQKLHLVTTDFVDGVHTQASVPERIFKELKERGK